MSVRKVIAVILTVILALSSAALAVSEPKKVTKMKFKKSLITVRAGEEQKLQLVIKGKGKKPTLRSVVFDHSDIISISYYAKKKPYFVVDGLKAGTTTLTARLQGVTARATVQVLPAASERVCMDYSSLLLSQGKTQTIKAWVEPSTANQSLTWKSSDTSVATVNSSGLVTAVSAGKATITATDTSGKRASCAVTVEKKDVPATDIKLSVSDILIAVGKTKTVTATVLPSDATNSKVYWTGYKPYSGVLNYESPWEAYNQNAATISSSGVVTGKAVGTMYYIATTYDVGYSPVNGHPYSIDVTAPYAILKAVVVDVPVTGVGFDMGNLTLPLGYKMKVEASVRPTNADNKYLSFTSSKPSVAAVKPVTVSNPIIGGPPPSSFYIEVTGSSGSTVLKVKSDEGGYTDSITVTAKPVKYGDLNNDNNVSITDLSLISNYLEPSLSLNSVKWINEIAADVDGNGKVEEADKSLISDYIMGRITRFPVEN